MHLSRNGLQMLKWIDGRQKEEELGAYDMCYFAVTSRILVERCLTAG